MQHAVPHLTCHLGIHDSNTKMKSRQSPSFHLPSYTDRAGRPCHQWQGSFWAGLYNAGSTWGWHHLETGSRKKHPPSNVPGHSLEKEEGDQLHWVSNSGRENNSYQPNCTLHVKWENGKQCVWLDTVSICSKVSCQSSLDYMQLNTVTGFLMSKAQN